MQGLNGQRLTDKEFNGYFTDLLGSLVRKTFATGERLVFVTYQPDTTTLDAKEVAKTTNQLFSTCKYVEVLEQTYKASRLWDTGKFDSGYHSHIIMAEKDYKTLSKWKIQLNSPHLTA